MVTTTADDMVGQLGALDNIVGYHLRRASAAFATDFARALAGTGMRQVLFGVLSVVSANPCIRQGEVGKSLGIQRANMVALTNELVDRGLLDRRPSDEDRRAMSLTLSSKGSAMLSACLVRIEAHEAEMLADLAPDEREILITLLTKIRSRPD